MEKRSGIYNRLPNVPNPNPQPRAKVIGMSNGSEPPTLYAVGKSPPIVVRVVNKIGRNRLLMDSAKISSYDNVLVLLI